MCLLNSLEKNLMLNKKSYVTEGIFCPHRYSRGTNTIGGLANTGTYEKVIVAYPSCIQLDTHSQGTFVLM